MDAVGPDPFHDICCPQKIHYIRRPACDGFMADKRGRPAKGYADTKIRAPPTTLTALRTLAARWNLSQGEAVQKLLDLALNEDVAMEAALERINDLEQENRALIGLAKRQRRDLEALRARWRAASPTTKRTIRHR